MVRPHKEHRHKKAQAHVEGLEPVQCYVQNVDHGTGEEHDHKKRDDHEHDLALSGVLLHVLGDAINNNGLIVAALVIWKAKYEGRYYADPGVSMGISFIILVSCLPLSKPSYP
jgi:solute carrier family 30 (zinc transporter), member 1